jgi:hypothetical protein
LLTVNDPDLFMLAVSKAGSHPALSVPTSAFVMMASAGFTDNDIPLFMDKCSFSGVFELRQFASRHSR